MNALRPSVDPTDRSMLRVMITIVWPTATIAMIDTLRTRSRSESSSTKRGSNAAVTPMSRASATTSPSSRKRVTASTS
jgi:hypothetical protein